MVDDTDDSPYYEGGLSQEELSQITELVDGTPVAYSDEFNRAAPYNQGVPVTAAKFIVHGRGSLWFFGDTGAYGHARKTANEDRPQYRANEKGLLNPLKLPPRAPEPSRFYVGRINPDGTLDNNSKVTEKGK